MPLSNRLRWPIPSLDQDPWFDAFVSLANAQDASALAALENNHTILMGGGTFSFDTGTGLLSWSAAVEITSPFTGFLHTVSAGSIVVPDGQFVYCSISRSLTSNETLLFSVSSAKPSNVAHENLYILGIRRGAVFYFRNGDTLPTSNVSSLASLENDNTTMMGGGTFDFNTGTGLLSWSATIEITSPFTGFLHTISAGNITVADNQFVYCSLTRGLTGNEVRVVSVASSKPPAVSADNFFVLGVRRGSVFYLRDGRTLPAVVVESSPIGWFGDGKDGTVTWDGSTTILGMAPSGNVYTLTRDVMVLNSTVNTGVTVDTAGWRYFDAGTLTLSGTGSISRNGGNGGNASGATGGAAGAAARGTNQFLANGGTGGAGTSSGTPGSTVSNCARRLTAGQTTGGAGGGVGVNGTAGTAGGVGQGGSGGGGGGGAASGVGLTGGNGGLVGIPNATGLALGADTSEIWTAYNGAQPRATGTQLFAGSGGGSGGTYSSTFVGCGGGGSPGAYCVVAARKITGSGKIQSNGGNGGNGGALGGNPGGAGGGGGGAGGIVVVITTSSTSQFPDAQIEANGGTGGTGGVGVGGAGSGGAGGAGGAGLKHIFRV